jgi:hypothetical protein
MFKALAENVSLAVAAAAAVTFDKTPFIRDKPCNVLLIAPVLSAGTPTIKIQGSDDAGATWTDLATWQPTAPSTKLVTFIPKKQQRLNVTVVGTGTVSAYADCDP